MTTETKNETAAVVAEIKEGIKANVADAVKEAVAAKADASAVTALKEESEKALAERDAQITELKGKVEAQAKAFNVMDEQNRKHERSAATSEAVANADKWLQVYREEAQGAIESGKRESVVADLMHKEFGAKEARAHLEAAEYAWTPKGMRALEERLGSADPAFKSARAFYETLTSASTSAGALMAGPTLLPLTNAANEVSEFVAVTGRASVSEQGEWQRPILGDGAANVVSPRLTTAYADSDTYDASSGESSGLVGDIIAIPRVNENVVAGARFNVNEYVLQPAGRAMGLKMERDALVGNDGDDWSFKGAAAGTQADPASTGATRFTALYKTPATAFKPLSVKGGVANSLGANAQEIVDTLRAGMKALYNKAPSAIGNAVFVMNPMVFSDVRATLTGTNGQNGFLWDATYNEGAGTTPILLGHRVVLSSYLPATFASGTSVAYLFGDFRDGYTMAQSRSAYVRRIDVTPPVVKFVVKARATGAPHDVDKYRVVIAAA